IAAEYRVCATKTDGTLWCGDAGFFEKPSAELEQFGTHANWSAVSVGIDHVCGIRESRVSCWGANDLGQLGTGQLD
ncbi:MAG TPA: hypothetical protein VFG30_29580, partial [Polyangiales bacterium]|nr:hypothetical protein [Polyangiales bacterium]